MKTLTIFRALKIPKVSPQLTNRQVLLHWKQVKSFRNLLLSSYLLLNCWWKN